MSIAETRRRIEILVDQDDAKVITISGLWGSGKTHLWHSIKTNSKNKKIRDARYVSLFGVSDIKSVKEALLRNILGQDKQGSNFRNKFQKIAGYISNVTSQFVKGGPAFLDFSDIALPYYLKDSFVVIDDIERLEKELGVIQIMGFINEYISQYQTRFLLIMNMNEMSPENLKAWKVMNEKLVDFEVFHTISPSEAFKIAAEGHYIPHRNDLESAISILNIGNIRVIKKILNLSASIVSKCGSMKEGELSRIIPNIVLTAGVYYKAIGIWDNTEEYINFMQMKGFRESENEKISNESIDIINRLGLVDAGLIASSILRVIEEYPCYNEESDIIFKKTTRNEMEGIATRKYNDFCANYYWEFKRGDDEISKETLSLLDYVEFLNPKDISYLLDFMEDKAVLKEYVDKFREKWIVKQKSKEMIFHSYDLLYYNGEGIRQDIYSHISTPLDDIKVNDGVKDAIEHVTLFKGAGERERAVFRSSTVSSIKDEIYAFSGTELKDFIGHVGFISQPGRVSDLSLEDIAHKLREAAESIISENRYPRLTYVLEQRLDRFIPARSATDGGESSESEPA